MDFSIFTSEGFIGIYLRQKGLCRLLRGFLTPPGTLGTWRQRRLCYVHVLVQPCPIYTQPMARLILATSTNDLKIVSTRAGFEPTISECTYHCRLLPWRDVLVGGGGGGGEGRGARGER